MNVEVADRGGAREQPFSSRPGSGGGTSGTATQQQQPNSPATGKRFSNGVGGSKFNRSASFAVVGDNDPYALVYSTPAHALPSLAKPAYATEPLFQYYALRGYKELLNESDPVEAGRAAQACLEGKPASESAAAARDALLLPHSRQLHDKAPVKHTHVIDRCLATAPAAGIVPLYIPLRPPQKQDTTSHYRTQRADDTRSIASAQRRAHLQQPPTSALYLGRYYPPESSLMAAVTQQTAAATAEASAAPAAETGPLSPAITSPSAASARTFNNNNTATAPPTSHGRTADSNRPGSVSSARTPSLAVPVRTPAEVAAQAVQEREGRRLLALQIDEAFVAAYHVRNPAAAERQRERDEAAARRRSSQAAAELLADTGADSAAAKSRGPSAASRGSTAKSGKKKSVSKSAVAEPVKKEGGVPTNLTVFQSALLLACNEDGAVTLDQLRAILADVPFVVSTAPLARSAAVMAGGPSAANNISAPTGSAVQTLFAILHPGTRAPNATDATDLLLAVASATGAGGGGGGGGRGQLGDASVSFGTGGIGSQSTSRANAGNSSVSVAGGRRGPGASASGASATVVSGPLGRSRQSIASPGRGGNSASPLGSAFHAPGTSVSFASTVGTPQNPPSGGGMGGAWGEVGSGPLSGRHQPQQQQQQGPSAAELRDGRKCVLVLEIMDALHALLNSEEMKNVVRWESFFVLAAEGNGYIHKSQLLQLRRHAYRDGSAAETNAPVTASMVKALDDAFALISAEEEAAYLKANKKGRKRGGGAAGGNLASNQKSAIPLHMMRRSHMDFALFCRFFDELPQIAAAFAHVWLPLLMSGMRPRTTTSTAATSTQDGEENAPAAVVVPLEGVLSLDKARGEEGDEAERPATTESGGDWSATRTLERTARPQQKSAAAAPASPEEVDGFPLELLGSTAAARQATVYRLLATRQEQMQAACDAAEKEAMERNLPSGSGAFGAA